jgi:sec-independent protein translocase protein TatA
MLFGKMEELLIVLAIVVILFGGKKLPQLARGIGESIRELRGAVSDGSHDEAKKSETRLGEADKTA